MFGFGKKKELSVDCVTVSETGLVRKDNQDSVFINQAKTVFCVADGMGGGSEGATASRFVCEAIERECEGGEERWREKVEQRLNAAIAAANARILAYAKEKGFQQMGSTLAAVLLDPNDVRKAAICHIGDSRIYRVRRGSAELLTKDHTIGVQLGELTKGVLSAELKSRTNPLAHVLTRAIGATAEIEGEWRKIDVMVDDRFLVCSDGVHDVIADSLIGEILSMSKDLEAASKRLSDEVVRFGAPDNFSYVMIEIGNAR